MRFRLIDLHEGGDAVIVESDYMSDLTDFIVEQETNFSREPYPSGRVLQILRVNDLLSSMEEKPVYEVLFTIVRGNAA